MMQFESALVAFKFVYEMLIILLSTSTSIELQLRAPNGALPLHPTGDVTYVPWSSLGLGTPLATLCSCYFSLVMPRSI